MQRCSRRARIDLGRTTRKGYVSEGHELGVIWLLPTEVVFRDNRQPQLLARLGAATLLMKLVEAEPVLPREEDIMVSASRTPKLFSHALFRVERCEGTGLRRNNERAVHLNCNAPLKEVHRDDQEALVWFGPKQDPLGTCQQPVCESDSLSLPKIWMRPDREAGIMYLLDGHDLVLRNYCQAIPRFAQNLHEAPRLAQLDITSAVHGMVKEQVTRKHGNRSAIPRSITPGPCIHSGQE